MNDRVLGEAMQELHGYNPVGPSGHSQLVHDAMAQAHRNLQASPATSQPLHKHHFKVWEHRASRSGWTRMMCTCGKRALFTHHGLIWEQP